MKNPAAPQNEPVRSYAPGTIERESLKRSIASISASSFDVPLRIGDREVRTHQTANVTMPHNHRHVIATWHQAGPAEVEQAIQAATETHREWSTWKLEDRAAIFLRAADLLSTVWRDRVNAATMLNQSKTAYQAEIDSACEMIDFLRFNVAFAEQIHERGGDAEDREDDRAPRFRVEEPVEAVADAVADCNRHGKHDPERRGVIDVVPLAFAIVRHVSFRVAQTARNPPPIDTASPGRGRFLAVFAARNDINAHSQPLASYAAHAGKSQPIARRRE